MQTETMSRRGYTLIELLVVIAIIAFLFGLTAVFFPSFQSRNQVERAADQLSGALLISKQQARRDGLPTGLRLTPSTVAGSSGYSLNGATQLQYIQQPDDFAIGAYTAANGAFAAQFSGVDFRTVYTLSGSAEPFQVQAGDYLEIYGGGAVRRIASIDATTGTILNLEATSTPLPTTPVATPNTTNYRIIPQPRTLTSLPPVILPAGSAIDLSTLTIAGVSPNPTFALTNVPTRTTGGTTYYEILFSPSGALVTGQGIQYFWVRDPSNNNSADLQVGNPQLIAVYPRTGFIAAHPVAWPLSAATNNNPFFFLSDARSSGM